MPEVGSVSKRSTPFANANHFADHFVEHVSEHISDHSANLNLQTGLPIVFPVLFSECFQPLRRISECAMRRGDRCPPNLVGGCFKEGYL